MQQSRDKYFHQLENQGINPVGGTSKSQSMHLHKQSNKLAPNAIKGLSIPSRLLAKVRFDRDR